MTTATTLTPKRAASRLNAHHLKTRAGFYARTGPLSGRFFGARVKAGALEVTPDFESWQPVDLKVQTFGDGHGRTVFM